MPDDELDDLYARGDFAAVRRTAATILGDPAADADTRARAQRYLARISVDMYVLAMLGFALLLFCAIVLRHGFS